MHDLLIHFKNNIKNNKLLYNEFSRLKALFPKRLYYPSCYFLVFQLNSLNETEEGKIKVDAVLRSRLADLLRDALQNVPYYRDTVKLNWRNIVAENVWEALMQFPYLEKKTVMQCRESFVNERFDISKMSYVTSGGSTGEGIGLWRDKRERPIETAFFAYEWGKLGLDWRKSRIVRIATEARKSENEDPFTYLGNRLLVSPYHLNEKWLNLIYRRIRDFHVEFFHTYPSCLEALARFMEASQTPKMKVKGLLLASEMFTLQQRELFKRTFDAPISTNYGLSERTNLAFSQDSESEVKYKLVDTYGFSENLCDQYGNYEIVGTSYWIKGMPFIRYRTQDFGRIKENGIIEKLDGRNQEYLLDRNGGRIPGFSIKIDEFTWNYVSVYQVVQREVGRLIIRIVPKASFNLEVKERLLAKQRERWGGYFDMDIETVSEIPRTRAGKFRLVVNEIAR